MIFVVPVRLAFSNLSCALVRNRIIVLTLAFLLLIAHLQSARGENHADYRYEDYREENDRMLIQTHAVAFGMKLNSAVEVDGELVYDAVSGATPNGGLPSSGTRGWLTEIHPDVRQAGNLAVSVAWGANTTTPQFAYSLENDYESFGYSLNHTIDFNEKNTTLAIGTAYTHDNIFPSGFSGPDKFKDSGDFLLGITQLLGPKTVITANLTLGVANGYLDDPYKGIHIPYNLDGNGQVTLDDLLFKTFSEKRPRQRTKQIGYVSLTQYITPIDASVEGSYRFYHDSYGIVSHTFSLNWYQKLGKHVILSPMLRFTDQGAADFYMTQLPGNPYWVPDPQNPDITDPFYAPFPENYSSDYRLASLQTITYGIGATVKIHEHVSLDFSFKRYEMHGKDNVTSSALFPKANVFSIGARIWF